MKTNFKVGDRVRGIAGKTEGSISLVRESYILVDFEAFCGIYPAHKLERVETKTVTNMAAPKDGLYGGSKF